MVEGRLQIREWQDKEGNKRRSAEINADNVYFGDSRPAQAEGASGYGEADAFKDFPPLDDFHPSKVVPAKSCRSDSVW